MTTRNRAGSWRGASPCPSSSTARTVRRRLGRRHPASLAGRPGRAPAPTGSRPWRSPSAATCSAAASPRGCSSPCATTPPDRASRAPGPGRPTGNTCDPHTPMTGVRLPHPGRRPAAPPLAARPRTGRAGRSSRWRRALDDDPRHPRRVARVDRPARSTGPGPVEVPGALNPVHCRATSATTPSTSSPTSGSATPWARRGRGPLTCPMRRAGGGRTRFQDRAACASVAS